MNWKGKKVLVTGAGGFIGSHLTERLVRLGANVKAFLRYNSRSDEGNIKLLSRDVRGKVRISYGEIRELETVREAMKGIDTVFNLAALIGIPYSYEHPQEVVETNVIGTLNVLIAARDEKVRRLIQTSTSEVYGSSLYIPINEKHPLQPQSPYSASKISSDAISLSFYYSFGLPVSIIRPFNTYGPRQSARAVIPTIIMQILTKNKVALGSIKPKRDLTYVSDTVEGFIKVAESPRAIGEVINIGSGYEITISELANKIIKIIGKDVQIKVDKKRIRPSKSEVKRLCADNSKAAKVLGWKPKISLDEGLRMTIDYIENHLNYYKPDEYIV